jgi:hypothetical protein
MISTQDRTILRDVAARVAEIAALPVQSKRREMWKRHNSLQPTRPLVLIFPEGSWVELLPDSSLTCQGEEARAMERELRRRIYYHDHLQDDTVVEAEWPVHKVIHNSGWGLEAERTPSTEARGAWRFAPVIRSPSDLERIQFPTITYDSEATTRSLAQAQEVFRGLLDIRPKGVDHISYHLMNQYTGWRGLAEVMLDMHVQPQMLHDAMALLEEGHRRVLQQYTEHNLLSLNNDGTYHSSGGNGYTDDLPAPGFDPQHVRPCDMWASAEAQELALVGPDHHREFSLEYEKRLLAPFGLTGYGCCEDLVHKLDDVLSIPHIRRISISPFADVDAAAERLGDAAIFSWKPHPGHLVGVFDEDRIRRDIRRAIAAAQRHDCVLEMILKDTHTCEHRPERFDRWVQIAMEEVNG